MLLPAVLRSCVGSMAMVVQGRVVYCCRSWALRTGPVVRAKLNWAGSVVFFSKAINITHSDLDSSKKRNPQSDLGPLPGIFLPEVKMPRNSSKIMATV